jgi:hypothetical protein
LICTSPALAGDSSSPIFVTSKHVWMPAQQFGDNARGHSVEAKEPALLGHARVKNHLQQQVAKFVLQTLEVVAGDGVGHFVGFFECIGRDAGKVLLQIPGTTVLRVSQCCHNFE